MLPADVLCVIFSDLNLVELASSIQVCKCWCCVISGNPGLFIGKYPCKIYAATTRIVDGMRDSSLWLDTYAMLSAVHFHPVRSLILFRENFEEHWRDTEYRTYAPTYDHNVDKFINL